MVRLYLIALTIFIYVEFNVTSVSVSSTYIKSTNIGAERIYSYIFVNNYLITFTSIDYSVRSTTIVYNLFFCFTYPCFIIFISQRI